MLGKLKQGLARRKLKRASRSLAGDIALTLFLGLFGLFSVWPLIFIINNAFKPLNEIFLFPPKLFVRNPTLNNFKDLAILIGDSWIPFSRYVFNTAFLTILGTAGTVLLSSMAAFPLAKYKFPGSKVMSDLIVYSLMFSGAVTGIPNYIIISKLGLVDSYWGIVLPAMSGTLGLFLMRNFMQQIPDSLLDAAKIDGASEYRVFWSIAMPACKPAWITLIIFSFQGLWGETGGMIIYTEKLKPVNHVLSQIIGGGIARTGAASAVSLIMLVVPVVVFVVTQSNVIETMTTSGIDG